MIDGKELRSRDFFYNPRFSYLAKEDHYLFAKQAPKYKFNVIGCGLNGNEHIQVTQLEGRASIHGVYDQNPGSIEIAQKNVEVVGTNRELIVRRVSECLAQASRTREDEILNPYGDGKASARIVDWMLETWPVAVATSQT